MPVAEADVLLVESTYGNRVHPPDDPTERLIAAVRRAVDQKGWLLIPAFAVGRVPGDPLRPAPAGGGGADPGPAGLSG